jgi:hypothetical protein
VHACLQALAKILRSKLVTSAMTRSSIVDLLRAMLQGTRGRGRGAPLTPPPMSPGAAALTEAVFQTVSGAGVVPALMVAYSEADAVEGLDVDKYHFDKFNMRHNVDAVLRELWQDERCLHDLFAMAAPDHPQCAPAPHACMRFAAAPRLPAADMRCARAGGRCLQTLPRRC